MAKASVSIFCTGCNKEFKHEKICYNRDQANAYEDWARVNITLCPACYRELMQENERRAQEKALDGVELAELTGTEKQTRWATDIRREAVAAAAKHKPNEKFWQAVNAKTDAKWWIDNRFEVETLNGLCKALSK